MVEKTGRTLGYEPRSLVPTDKSQDQVIQQPQLSPGPSIRPLMEDQVIWEDQCEPQALGWRAIKPSLFQQGLIPSTAL